MLCQLFLESTFSDGKMGIMGCPNIYEKNVKCVFIQECRLQVVWSVCVAYATEPVRKIEDTPRAISKTMAGVPRLLQCTSQEPYYAGRGRNSPASLGFVQEGPSARLQRTIAIDIFIERRGCHPQAAGDVTGLGLRVRHRRHGHPQRGLRHLPRPAPEAP